MPTADWVKIHFEGVEDEDLEFSIVSGQAKAILGDYTIMFDMESLCCEDYGIKFIDERFEKIINSTSIYGNGQNLDSIIEQILPHFEDLSHVELKMIPDHEQCGDGGEFILEFDDDRSISFYNYHNGYYGHSFSISKGETCIFQSYL